MAFAQSITLYNILKIISIIVDLRENSCYIYIVPKEVQQNITKFGGDFMSKVTIKLAAINDVKEFVNTVMRFDFDVDLISGRYAVDAKSIMGIFSLDLSKPIELEAHTDDATVLFAAIKPFIID